MLVPFNFLAEFTSDYPLGYPPYSLHPISAYASFDITGISPQNFSTESGCFPWTRTDLGLGLNRYSVSSSNLEIAAHVGDVLTIGAAIGIIGQANITDADRKLDWGGYVDGRNTAGIWLGMLPAGMTVAGASGHDYRVDPRAVSAVPLPAALWRAAGAPGGLGFARRRGGPP